MVGRQEMAFLAGELGLQVLKKPLYGPDERGPVLLGVAQFIAFDAI